ncbi:helix-turn-helix transcriptional regulator [Catenovulum sp. SM1970]|uniref:helix-turn-helix domain-containing protein n=1 Tax=Marinifaba aquimaris TaxID=2741323 RepID=UPI001573AC63|nr:helix-turn-helix transcriptional regulator [Marinifaba aquimaris]NTS77497.1 helix-turn-helix transcriptional regulator [Marinifaba aquimaris]
MSELILEFTRNFYILGSILGFILSVLLFNCRSNLLACRILAVWVVLFSVELAEVVAIMSHIMPFAWHVTFDPVYGVLFYFYARTLARSQPFSAPDLIHLFPVLSCYALAFSTEIQFGPVLGLLYGCYTVYFMYQHQREIKRQLSDIQKSDLNWLLTMSVFQVIIWSAVLSMWAFSAIIPESWNIVLISTSFIPATLWLFVLAYFGLTKAAIFQFQTPAKETVDTRVSQMDEAKKQRLTTLLFEAMEGEQLYLQPQLTLTQLSEHIKASRHDISCLLNIELKLNFYDFINGFRVNEAKRLLEQSQSKILAVAFDSGFSSKSNFNKLFKEHTGYTPSEYRKQTRQQNSALVQEV